jgi:DNA-binding response OmpR family regulator/predicted regulator of Ras-like GTPase activity (Roadblock/LC7/MglB family)
MVQQWRILVVENEENLNWNIVNTLQKDGYFVRGVGSGSEAIRLLWSEECDVVICNQQMGDADGFELLQWMRTYCPGTRMIMVAVPGGNVTRTQALEMGVASYLEKPLDLRMLKEELRRLLHQTGFSASLDSFDLLDVIQIITMSRKSIALVVSTGLEEEGVLRFQGGELTWAEYGTLRGEEAFFALAAHKNGTVVHRPSNDQITPNVTQPLSRLIFQALQYRSKYAQYQQQSSELEAVRLSGSDSQVLPSLPRTTIPEALPELEEDDRPFQFLAEDMPAAPAPSSQAFEQYMSNGALQDPLSEPFSGFMGVVRNTDMESGAEQAKEWWEPTGPIPSVQRSGNIHAITDEALGRSQEPGGMNIIPSTVRKATNVQNNGLPSWLTDQPTNRDLPVLRDNTGKMSAAAKEQSSSLPVVPNSTGQMPMVSREQSPIQPSSQPPVSALPMSSQPQMFDGVWSEQAGHLQFDPSESGLRKIKPDEALYTGTQRAVKSNPGQSGALVHPAPAEWQSSWPAIVEIPTGQMSPVKSPEMPGQSEEIVQNLVSLKKTGAQPPVEPRPSGSGISPTSMKPTSEANTRTPNKSTSGPDKATKRNYPALAAALQTLGYSVPGFVASAVVSLDGIPIAQVAVDELDIAPMCMYFSSVMQGVLQALEQGQWEDYEHTVITSRSQYIFLRIVGDKKDVFQVLITTRESDPSESLEVMANVEAAVAAALS